MERIVIIGSEGSLLVNFRLSFMKLLLEKGYEVHAIASDQPGVRDVLQECGVHFCALNVNRHTLSIFNSIKYCAQLRYIVKRIKPDLCFAYNVKPVIFGIISAKSLGLKRNYALITGLGYPFIAKTLKARLVFSFVSILYRIAFKFCRKVIFQNGDDKKYFCKLNLLQEEKAGVVNGSGVDLSYFRPALFPNKLTFLMISRFLPEKGINEYVKACAALKQQYSNVRCCLVGYIDNTFAGIRESDIRSWEKIGIEYLGKQQDVRLVLADASVFVLPSYREGTPRAVLEAMAMGRPIITTDAPGCRDTVVNGLNGFLVPIKDSDALYQIMLRFIHDPSLISKMGKESLRIVNEKFDVDRVNQKMLEIMDLEKPD